MIIDYLAEEEDIEELEFDPSTMLSIAKKFDPILGILKNVYGKSNNFIQDIKRIKALPVDPKNVNFHIRELIKVNAVKEVKGKTESYLKLLMEKYEEWDTQDVLEKAESNILEISNKYSTSDEFEAQQIGVGLREEYENRTHNPNGFVGKPTPFPTLNEMTNGVLRPGSVTLFNARSGVGKSIILKNIVKCVGYDHDEPVYWGFNEMTKSEQKDRLLAEIIEDERINTKFLSNGLYNKPENADLKEKVMDGIEKLENAPIYLDQVRGYTPEILVRRARYFKKRYNIKGFVWDYVKKSSAFTGEKKALRHWLGDVVNFMKEEIADPLEIFVASAVQAKTFSDELPSESADMWRQSTAFISLRKLSLKEKRSNPLSGDYALSVIKNRYGKEHDNIETDFISLDLNKSKLRFYEVA